MEAMYETLKKLYLSARLSMTGLTNAVLKGWITQEQQNQIINESLKER